MSDVTHERRLRVVRVGLRFVLNWMCMAAGYQPPTCVQIPRLNLPKGCRVHGVHCNQGGMTFDVYVHHPSFDEVPDGQEPPQHEALLRYDTYEIKQPDDSTPTIAHGTPA